LLQLPIVFTQITGIQNILFVAQMIGFATAQPSEERHSYYHCFRYISKKSDSFCKVIIRIFGIAGGIALSLFVQNNLFVHYRSIGKIETVFYIMFIIFPSAYLLD
jgi:ACS family hexuronate transporter-like MFS transporter